MNDGLQKQDTFVLAAYTENYHTKD